jgi:hypothetical protein
MRKFILNTVIIICLYSIALIGLVVLSSFLVKKRNFKNFQTEGNLLVLKEKEHYDICVMGISHARNFSRHKNHLRVENILHKKMLNLGQGYAKCGVNDQLFYLEYFYSHNVKVDTILYILSPPLLYGDYLNKSSGTFVLEPFRFDFFKKYLAFDGAENKYNRLLYYVSSKLHPKWLFHFPKNDEKKKDKLVALDTAVVNAGFKMAYLEGESEEIFNKNCGQVENTIKVAKANRSHIIFVIPPALFGKWKGHNETIEFCKKMKEKYNTSYYDFSESVLEPQYYYDHHHLNSDGVVYFTSNYLAPVFHPESAGHHFTASASGK